MIAKSAVLAALTLFLLMGWLAGELRFLAPYKATLFRQYGWTLAGVVLLVFLNLCVLYDSFGRWLFLRDAGRKLLHLDRQLGTPDAALQDLGPHLDAQDMP